MSTKLDWYIEYFRKENLFAMNERFSGSLLFKVNYREGGPSWMNIEVSQSVKPPEQVEIKTGGYKQ